MQSVEDNSVPFSYRLDTLGRFSKMTCVVGAITHKQLKNTGVKTCTYKPSRKMLSISTALSSVTAWKAYVQI